MFARRSTVVRVKAPLGITLCAHAAVAMASLALAAPATADDCVDGYLARCSGPGVSTPRVTGPAGQVPTVQGVPCTGRHLGVCIALTQGRGDFGVYAKGPSMAPDGRP